MLEGNDQLKFIISLVSKGDTAPLQALFQKAGGRKHLELIVSVVLTNIPGIAEDKLDVFAAFLETLDIMEERIKHQEQGKKILQQLYYQ